MYPICLLLFCEIQQIQQLLSCDIGSSRRSKFCSMKTKPSAPSAWKPNIQLYKVSQFLYEIDLQESYSSKACFQHGRMEEQCNGLCKGRAHAWGTYYSDYSDYGQSMYVIVATKLYCAKSYQLITILKCLSGDISSPVSTKRGDTPPCRLPGPRVNTFPGCNLPLPCKDHFQKSFGKKCCNLVWYHWRSGHSHKRLGPGEKHEKTDLD